MAPMTMTSSTTSIKDEPFTKSVRNGKASNSFCRRCYLSSYGSLPRLDIPSPQKIRANSYKSSTPPEVITPIDESSGYISLSSLDRKRRDSLESFSSNSGSIPTAKPEPDFLSSRFNPFSDFTKRHNSKLSLAEEAVPFDTEGSEEIRDGDQKSTILDTLSKPFLKINLPRIPDRGWFCKNCRRPNDQCRCLCVIS